MGVYRKGEGVSVCLLLRVSCQGRAKDETRRETGVNGWMPGGQECLGREGC